MKPGRELDALIAEKVMGWHDVFTHPEIVDNGCWYVGNMFKQYKVDFKPSTDIAAAWTVVEKFNSVTCQIIKDMDAFMEHEIIIYRCCILAKDDVNFHEQESFESMPHAIALAALKAVGG